MQELIQIDYSESNQFIIGFLRMLNNLSVYKTLYIYIKKMAGWKETFNFFDAKNYLVVIASQTSRYRHIFSEYRLFVFRRFYLKNNVSKTMSSENNQPV